MSKKIIFLLFALPALLGFAGLASAAVTIPNPLGGINNFGALLLRIAWVAGGLIASLGTIMIIVAGIMFLTSAGSAERMGAAKKALMYAIIGIIIGISASVIVATIQWAMGA